MDSSIYLLMLLLSVLTASTANGTGIHGRRSIHSTGGIESIEARVDECTFCLPSCTQPPFGAKLRSSYTVSMRSVVLTNDTTRCASVCDGKGIALGNLFTAYDVSVERMYYAADIATSLRDAVDESNNKWRGTVLQVFGVRTFETDPMRTGVQMDIGRRYWITASLSDVDNLVINRCVTVTPWNTLSRRQKRRIRRFTP